MKKEAIPLIVIFSLLAAVTGCPGKNDNDASGRGAVAVEGGAPIRHVIVYGEPGRFCGWPANNGVWRWGNEILVGFELAYYKNPDPNIDPTDHHFDRQKPKISVLARSLDGGETWKLEDPENFIADGGETRPSPGGVNFAHPDFAMRVGGNRFFVSYNRGKTWRGPYRIEMAGFDKQLTSRTDYIVNGKNDCFLFLSAREEAVRYDRALCARTTDGGKTFQFLSWMTNIYPPQRIRSVMPSTVRISDNELISAMRRKLRLSDPEGELNWIDVYVSDDNGLNWRFLSKVADTDNDEWNGNPPSMVKLRDGRICLTYGFRGVPWGIRAKLSDDNGRTWSEEIILRDDGINWDLGYTRTVQRPDGRPLTIYYYNTKESPKQHIAATIWDPDLARKNSSGKGRRTVK
ncbi:MAG: sialidase family protein [Planctomycetota bacterium]